MKIRLTLVLFFLFTVFSFSQETILEIKDPFKGSTYDLRQTLTAFYEQTDQLSIMFGDHKNVYGYLFDENLEKVTEIKSKALSSKYKIPLGYSISDSQHNFYFSNKKKAKFGICSFDFANQKSTTKELKIDFSEGEVFLESLTYNSNLLLFTIFKNSSLINVYVLNGDNIKKHKLDLSNNKFISKTSNASSLYSSLLKGNKLNLKKVEVAGLESIEFASEICKLFLNDDKIYISLDVTSEFTQIIEINLDNFKAEIQTIKKPYLEEKTNLKTNSFLFKDKLFILSVNRNEMVFNVRNLKSEEIIKEYRVTKEDTITFKNSPVIHKSSGIFNDIELKKTKTFLRDITQGKVGVLVTDYQNKYQISLGGSIVYSGGSKINTSFGATGTYGASSNVSSYYYSHSSTYINCLFDKEFNHIEGSVDENVFDKIYKYKFSKNEPLDIDAVFKYKGNVILGDVIFGSVADFRLLKFN